MFTCTCTRIVEPAPAPADGLIQRWSCRGHADEEMHVACFLCNFGNIAGFGSRGSKFLQKPGLRQPWLQILLKQGLRQPWHQILVKTSVSAAVAPNSCKNKGFGVFAQNPCFWGQKALKTWLFLPPKGVFSGQNSSCIELHRNASNCIELQFCIFAHLCQIGSLRPFWCSFGQNLCFRPFWCTFLQICALRTIWAVLVRICANFLF